jgi:hypothetical protein
LMLVGMFKKRTVRLFNRPHYHAHRIERWQHR